MRVGVRLRELREARGFSRQHVARDLDVSERTVIRDEQAVTLRRVKLLVYADYYGVTVAELETGKAAA